MFLQSNQLDDEVEDIMLYVTGASINRKSNIDVENKNI